MQLNKSDLEFILQLIEGKTFKKKNPSDVAKALKSNGSINIDRINPHRHEISLKKVENVYLFLQQKCNLNLSNHDELQNHINNFNTQQTRATIQVEQSNSKAKKSPSLKGLFLSSLTPIDIKINSDTVSIIPTNGLAYFCFHTEVIKIPSDVIIAGIENYQVVWFAQNYTRFFEHKKVLFVNTNPFMLEWIENLENEYIHFGDFDLAGINIYQNKVVPRLKKCKKHSMFIPDNIEMLIQKYGNIELFEKQKHYHSLEVHTKELFVLKEIIKKEKKALEQEALCEY